MSRLSEWEVVEAAVGAAVSGAAAGSFAGLGGSSPAPGGLTINININVQAGQSRPRPPGTTPPVVAANLAATPGPGEPARTAPCPVAVAHAPESTVAQPKDEPKQRKVLAGAIEVRYLVLTNPQHPDKVGLWQGPGARTWAALATTLRTGELFGSGAKLRKLETEAAALELWKETYPDREMPIHEVE
jgi:hypothetical protein